MQDPNAIIAQAKSGNVPATWRVVRPTKGYPVKAGFAGGFITLFAMFFLGILGFIVGGFLLHGAQTPSFDPQTLPYLGAGALALIVVIGLLSGFAAAGRVPNSYFVFTPEGAVQTIKPGKFMAIDYATLDLINYHVTVNTTRNVDARTGATLSTSSSVSVAAELHYRDGHKRRWKPAGRFGSTEPLVQRLINGLQEYKRMAGIAS